MCDTFRNDWFADLGLGGYMSKSMDKNIMDSKKGYSEWYLTTFLISAWKCGLA